MKIVFAGTPEFAVPTLEALHREGLDIAMVVTQPDRPRGRGLKLTPPAVKVAAERLGLPVTQPETVRGEAGQELLDTHKPDAVVIVAYGEIIPADLLSIPRFGWVNLHASLLPKYRGAAPIQWAIIRGESVTGVSTMQVEAGLDTGPVYRMAEVRIEPDDTAQTLGEKLSSAGAALMVQTLELIGAGKIEPVPQEDGQASKAPMLKKEHGRIDWSKPASEIHNLIRGVTPWPVAFTAFRGERLRIRRARCMDMDTDPSLELKSGGPGILRVVKEKRDSRVIVGCGDGSCLELLEVQPAGKRALSARDFANGVHLTTGETMGSP